MSEHRATSDTLETRLALAERRIEELTAYCEDLEDRLTRLAVAKVAESRFPFWNWELQRGMSQAERTRLTIVLTYLDDRVIGLSTPEALRKDIDGIPHDVLHGEAPLAAREAADAIKTVTGIVHDGALIDLVEALAGQGMVRQLCAFLLDALRPESGPAPEPAPAPRTEP